MAADHPMNLTEFDRERLRLSSLIDAGLTTLREQTVAYAESERTYRKAKSQAFLRCPQGTVPERTAWVQADTADIRYARDIAEGMKFAAREAVQARRAQLSALQSLLAAHKAEAEFDRTAA